VLLQLPRQERMRIRVKNHQKVIAMHMKKVCLLFALCSASLLYGMAHEVDGSGAAGAAAAVEADLVDDDSASSQDTPQLAWDLWKQYRSWDVWKNRPVGLNSELAHIARFIRQDSRQTVRYNGALNYEVWYQLLDESDGHSRGSRRAAVITLKASLFERVKLYRLCDDLDDARFNKFIWGSSLPADRRGYDGYEVDAYGCMRKPDNPADPCYSKKWNETTDHTPRYTLGWDYSERQATGRSSTTRAFNLNTVLAVLDWMKRGFPSMKIYPKNLDGTPGHAITAPPLLLRALVLKLLKLRQSERIITLSTTEKCAFVCLPIEVQNALRPAIRINLGHGSTSLFSPALADDDSGTASASAAAGKRDEDDSCD
jgi:hypothetical protein